MEKKCSHKLILNRVKVRNDLNELYFPNDQYQYLPKNGYTKLFEKILKHKNIKVSLNTPFNKSMEDEYDYVFNSMAIDEYYNYCYGELPYRSIKFHDVTYANFDMPTAVVNFTDEFEVKISPLSDDEIEEDSKTIFIFLVGDLKSGLLTILE